MKKIAAILLLSLTLLMPLYSAWTSGQYAENEMTVRGYKLNVDSTDEAGQIIIVDALSSQLNQVYSGDKINLTGHLDDMFGGNVSDVSSIADTSTQVAFSVRIVGRKNNYGYHTVYFDMEPFWYYGPEETDLYNSKDESGKYIDAFYALSNLRFIYLGNEEHETGEGFNYSYAYRTAVGFRNSLPHRTASDTANHNDDLDTLTLQWYVAPPADSASGSSIWSARGAVAVAVDYTQFSDNEHAPYGFYQAYVKVRYVLP